MSAQKLGAPVRSNMPTSWSLSTLNSASLMRVIVVKGSLGSGALTREAGTLTRQLLGYTILEVVLYNSLLLHQTEIQELGEALSSTTANSKASP